MLDTKEFKMLSKHITICMVLFGVFLISVYILQKVKKPYNNEGFMTVRDLQMTKTMVGKDLNNDENKDRFTNLWDNLNTETLDEKQLRLIKFMDDYYGDIEHIMQEKIKSSNNMMNKIQSVLESNVNQLKEIKDTQF